MDIEREHKSAMDGATLLIPHKDDGADALPQLPPITCAVDDIALDALMNHVPDSIHCSSCEELIAGEPAATGLFMWTRGDDIRFDEPPLCGLCAVQLNIAALHFWR